MQIQILQKNGRFNGFEFTPKNIYDNIKLHNMADQLRNLNAKIKIHKVKELKNESLIVR